VWRSILDSTHEFFYKLSHVLFVAFIWASIRTFSRSGGLFVRGRRVVARVSFVVGSGIRFKFIFRLGFFFLVLANIFDDLFDLRIFFKLVVIDFYVFLIRSLDLFRFFDKKFDRFNSFKVFSKNCEVFFVINSD